MSNQHIFALKTVLDGLMRRYRERVPNVSKIVSKMIEKGMVDHMDNIVNDHIAFRTLGIAHLGIQSLEKIFMAYGYTRQDYYHFEQKKLNAYWYSPPEIIPNLPRIFISECRVHDLSTPIQTLVQKYAGKISQDPVDQLDLTNGEVVDQFLHTRLWDQPTWDDYKLANDESEYVSWVLNNQYYLNHFTISVHALPTGYNTIEQFNDFLESIGIQLNDSGGKVKVSHDGKLRQSAAVSNTVDVLFQTTSGDPVQATVPGSYVEFAERIDGRDGFDPGNANNIFESTYSDQIDRT